MSKPRTVQWAHRLRYSDGQGSPASDGQYQPTLAKVPASVRRNRNEAGAEMFQLICQTCGEDRTYDEFDLCQEQFNDHVDRNHEVELLRTGPTTSPTETQGQDGSMVE